MKTIQDKITLLKANIRMMRHALNGRLPYINYYIRVDRSTAYRIVSHEQYKYVV